MDMVIEIGIVEVGITFIAICAILVYIFNKIVKKQNHIVEQLYQYRMQLREHETDINDLHCLIKESRKKLKLLSERESSKFSSCNQAEEELSRLINF